MKKGAKEPRKRSSPVGILYHVCKWALLVDFHSNYCFPAHMIFTQLRPDIIIFSNWLRKVIFIEENIKFWHGTSIKKYLAFKTMIESKGWCMELFRVELGARDTALNIFSDV